VKNANGTAVTLQSAVDGKEAENRRVLSLALSVRRLRAIW